MAQLVVRRIEESVKERLRERAARHGHSLEAEVREILREAVQEEEKSEEGLGTRLARRFAGVGLREGEEIEEIRGDWGFRIPNFEE